MNTHLELKMTTDMTELLGHLAWCAQIALGISRHDRRVTTPIQEHLFLMNWLSTAQKKEVIFKRDCQ
jgi:flavorubredoxin